MSSDSESVAKVTSIVVYPVKSCRGISVSHAALSPYGFRWDRNWMVVNERGRGYTQRIEPKLALIQVEMPTEAFDEGWEPTKDSFIVLKAPGMQPLKICLSKEHEVADGVSIWDWSGSAWHEGPEASKWFSDFFGKTSALIRFDVESQARLADPEFYHNKQKVLFSDGYQYLIASQGSLDVVNQHASEPIRINRFRANIIVEGCEPFGEDLWTKIKIGKHSFQSVRLCYRCKVPQVNQETGEVGEEPARTLKQIRSGALLRPQGGTHTQKLQIYFGQFLTWNQEDSSGNVIKLGDPIYVFGRVNHFSEAIA
ncbi:hypothetical protein PIB30_005252 [Stylosanthes scabra]|uniref:MOSC domain-containing protein n=1 Tax=Stylosanthes scabra TaxID=79078 RepID=A0ABU6T497_9FABA|nr:hypothetical protein [Stylosanthes scabra]